MRVYYNGKRLSNDMFLSVMFSNSVSEIEYNYTKQLISINRKPILDFMIIGFYILKKTEKAYKLSYLL